MEIIEIGVAEMNILNRNLFFEHFLNLWNILAKRQVELTDILNEIIIELFSGEQHCRRYESNQSVDESGAA